MRTVYSKEFAKMANGVDQILQELVTTLSVQITAYTELPYFAVRPLSRYYAILGNQWCASRGTKSIAFITTLNSKKTALQNYLLLMIPY